MYFFLMIHVYYTVHEKSFMCIVFFFVKALKGQCENQVREPVALLMLLGAAGWQRLGVAEA